MQVSDRAILPRGCEGDCRCSMNFMVSRVTASVNPRQEAGIGPHAKGRCRACRISGSTERYLIGVPGTFVSRLWGRIVSLVRGMVVPMDVRAFKVVCEGHLYVGGACRFRGTGGVLLIVHFHPARYGVHIPGGGRIHQGLPPGHPEGQPHTS